MIKPLLFAAATLLSAGSAFGQISITHINAPVAGDTNIYAVDTVLYPGFSSGTPGANQVYDYTTLALHYYDTIYYLDPMQTPYGANYPLSNLVRYDQDDTAMIFWHVDTMQIVDVGLAEDSYHTGNILQYHYDPTRLNITYPSTYNTYHPNDTSISDIVVAGSLVNQPYDSVRRKLTDNRTLIFDGWGKLMLASGSFDCLRESRQDAYTDSIWTRTGTGPWTLLKHGTKSFSTIRFFTSISNDPMVRIKYDASGNVKAAYYLVNPALFTGTGQAEEKTAIRVFPNPSTGEIFMLHNQGPGHLLVVTDLQGRIVKRETMKEGLHQLLTGGLVPGNYHFTVLSPDGLSSGSGSFCVQR